MALKRINKELTDLGRYVVSFPSTARLACSLLLAWAAAWQRHGSDRVRGHTPEPDAAASQDDQEWNIWLTPFL